jgi:predicted Zn-dependent protease
MPVEQQLYNRARKDQMPHRKLLIAAAFGLGLGTTAASHAFDFGSIVSAVKVGEAVVKGVEDLTPEQEHYLGRAVAARMLASYPPVGQSRKDGYLNEIGNYLATFSTLPETFGGYHFALVDSNEINAFAAPGGTILITRGLYQQARNEDQLAAVLAHEIAHVALRHGLSAIQQSNLAKAGTIIGKEVVKHKAGSDLAQVEQLTGVFGSSVEDIVTNMAESGYSKGQEFDADSEALRILHAAGYNPQGLSALLGHLVSAEKEAAAAGLKPVGFFATHPQASERLARVDGAISDYRLATSPSEKRDKRFARRH